MERSDRNEQREGPANDGPGFTPPDPEANKPLDPYELVDGDDDAPPSPPSSSTSRDSRDRKPVDDDPPDFGNGQVGATASFGSPPAAPPPEAPPKDAPPEPDRGPELEPADNAEPHELAEAPELEPAAPVDRPSSTGLPLDRADPDSVPADHRPPSEEHEPEEPPVVDERVKAEKRAEARRKAAEEFGRIEAARRKRRWIILGTFAVAAAVVYFVFL